MYEMKMASAAALMYRSILNLSIKLLYVRDKINVKRYHKKIRAAEDMLTMASRLKEEADLTLDSANIRMDVEQRKVIGAVSHLDTAKRNLPLIL